jgi:hypothetical protein
MTTEMTTNGWVVRYRTEADLERQLRWHTRQERKWLATTVGHLHGGIAADLRRKLSGADAMPLSVAA